ncbi:hypothetical protein NMS_0068 [Nonlabens marinus S1-08]|uniref:Uncharacterized protein n=1 Tax=Nonlabens marinus S1-08 TaxID=1454201 RepID=W8VVQ4_9FLAO|nr:hypothetical protein NMS_0068 [Nonlabens marinus S1-08]
MSKGMSLCYNHISTRVYIELVEMLDTGSNAFSEINGKPVRAAALH